MMKKRLFIFALLLAICVPMSASSISASEAETEAFAFAVFGENRPNRPDDSQPRIFLEIIPMINEFNPEFAFNTGDSIFGSSDIEKVEAQYKDYLEAISNLHAKVHLAVGNQEIMGRKSNQEFFESKLGELYYSFHHENAHFFVLNSEEIGLSHRITGDQFRWLREEFNKNADAENKFVFLHRPLYPVNGHIGNSMDKFPRDRDALHALFARNRVTAVFSGHEHLFDEQVRNGVRYIITGGAGAFLYPSVRGGGDFHHFIVVKVDGDEVEFKLVKPENRGRKAEIILIGKDPDSEEEKKED